MGVDSGSRLTNLKHRWCRCLVSIPIMFMVVGCERTCNPRISDAQAVEAARSLLSTWSVESFESANAFDKNVNFALKERANAIRRAGLTTKSFRDLIVTATSFEARERLSKAGKECGKFVATYQVSWDRSLEQFTTTWLLTWTSRSDRRHPSLVVGVSVSSCGSPWVDVKLQEDELRWGASALYCDQILSE